MKYLYLLVFTFWLFPITNEIIAQKGSYYTDSIRQLTSRAEKHLESDSSTWKAFSLIYEAEKLALKTQHPLDLLLFYRSKALLHFYTNKDEAKFYTDKLAKVIKSVDDSVEVGSAYIMMAAVESPNSDVKMKYTRKALKLLEKYGEPKDLIDVNFNISKLFRDRKQWDSSIYYSKAAIKAINASQVDKNRKKYLYLNLLDVYVDKKEYRKAHEVIDTLDQIVKTLDKNEFRFFTYLFYKKKLNYYNEIGDYKKASSLYLSTFEVMDSLRNLETKIMEKAMKSMNELTKEREEIKRIAVENELKKAIIRKNRITIVLITILLIILSFSLLYFYQNSKKVTNINNILQKKNNDLTIMKKRLEDAIKSKTNFMNVMTHELFTPINGITILAHNLKKEHSEVERNKNIELLELSNDYLHRLVKNIIDIKSIENSKNLKLKLESVNIRHFIDNICDTADIFFKNSTNTISHDLDPNIPTYLKMDTSIISHILINLLNNANKFTSKGKIHFKICLEKEEDTRVRILFSVSDTGIGIEKEHLRHIFDKFRHGSEKIKNTYGGSGNGLYVVKHFLTLYNSHINVKTSEKKGSTFYFSIWIEKVREKSSKNTEKINKTTPNRILLVDDNKLNLLVTRKLLESKSNNICDTAESGYEAIEMLKSKQYDVIFMDILMPGMNGFETTNKIKEQNITTPVIALTAIEKNENKKEFSKTAFAAVVHKPFHPDDLFNLIKTVTKKTS